jgi:hypothetical protein
VACFRTDQSDTIDILLFDVFAVSRIENERIDGVASMRFLDIEMETIHVSKIDREEERSEGSGILKLVNDLVPVVSRRPENRFILIPQ